MEIQRFRKIAVRRRLRNSLPVIVALVFIGTCASFSQAFGQLVFEQSFSAGGVVGDYDDGVTNEFDGITTSGGGFVWSLDSGRILGTRSANAGALTRSTDLATGSGAIYEFTIDVESITTPATTAAAFYAGSSLTNANSPPANPNVHSRFGINLTGTNSFQVRDIGNSNTFPTVFSGLQSLFFVVNNSGNSFTYTAPGGGTESLGNDAWDLWVGSTRAFNDIAATTGAISPTDFKLLFDGAVGSAFFDEFRVTAIPEPAALFSLFVGWMLIASRRPRRT